MTSFKQVQDRFLKVVAIKKNIMKVQTIIVIIVALQVTEYFCAPLDTVDHEQSIIKLLSRASFEINLNHFTTTTRTTRRPTIKVPCPPVLGCNIGSIIIKCGDVQTLINDLCDCFENEDCGPAP